MAKQVVNLNVDRRAVDKDADKKYQRGRTHVHSRAMMPEKQLFSFAEYEAQAAERTGYSEYSYWKSVWRNFLKKKSAVAMLVIFFLLFAFTFGMRSGTSYDLNVSSTWFKVSGGEESYCRQTYEGLLEFSHEFQPAEPFYLAFLTQLP